MFPAKGTSEYDALSGGFTDKSNMTREKALAIGALWRGVWLISGHVGKIPIFVYQNTDNGKERAYNSPVTELLRYRPNRTMTALHFRQTMTALALLHGNSFAWILRDDAGRPEELLLLDPTQTVAARKDGEPIYITVNEHGNPMKMLRENVLHIRGMSLDGVNGLSLVKYGAIALGYAYASQQHGKKFFDQGTSTNIAIEHPAAIGEDAVKNLRNSWDRAYGGVENHHRPLVLEEGAQAKALNLSAKDAQLIEAMNFSLRDVANWLGIPPHKLGDNTRTAYNSLEAENQSFLSDCLDYWLVNWEQEAREKMLSERQKERQTHFIEFERKALVQADLKTRAEYYKMATGGRPWMAPDEVREKENMNLALGEQSEVKDPTNNFADDDGKEGSKSRVYRYALENLESAIKRMQNRVQIKAGRSKNGKLEEYKQALADESSDERKTIREALQKPADILEAITGNDALTNAEQRVLEVQDAES